MLSRTHVMKHQTSYLKRAREIQRIVSRHYEPGRQDRNLSAVYRRHVEPRFGITYKTFLRARKIDTSPLGQDEPVRETVHSDEPCGE